ncbi:lipid II:glycine glycyltransferase FemX [Alkalitalea saponilacus]|uniref:Lipid II:glycine glycyltransferase (Peptidoglycan interpeptide bridge formation enzyme) n=1 Tax=Alkalitalea saponilacus TaxID=889453 RepID=A0A1T5AI14_9BACT|nr:peptidoglycan bridge formation glycyltransferase FemA/FemB family protein [Alkalitalea saponilacus]ASB48699.1 peptidoglycan bridge formation protein FemAB [Alkalitalea saponilacus]SKB34407.1 Lipid II:glycine glycyltransferase (Peptidoglycan interpeptide bridge formation enzyme) [Alkalitalea saponilacus]
MLSEVCLKHQEEVFETPIIQQTAFWSEVKKRMGVDTKAFNFKSRTEKLYNNSDLKKTLLSDLLIIDQKIDSNYSIAYVPYGPELEPAMENQGVFLEELSESLRSYLPKNCIMIRYDLLWQSHWAAEDDYYDLEGNWIGPPAKNIQEMRLNYNTINWNLRKSLTNLLPSNTVFLNLRKSEEQILASMKPKTRYNIRLAERKGVSVKEYGMENLQIWYNLYKETSIRNGLYLHNIEYFRTVLTAKAKNTNSPADVHLLVAEAGNEPLSAMFLVISGNRATYLYGASASNHKNYMGSYALQWKAIQMAKEKGCTDYDMFGVAPNPNPEHPMYGLYRFKTGFGGEIYHSMGSWDYPFKEEAYNYFIAKEMSSQGYYS